VRDAPRRAAQTKDSALTSTARRRFWLRIAIVIAATLVSVLLGASYPLLLRGEELSRASWHDPWLLLGLVIVPLVFWRGTFGEDRRTPRLLLGTLLPLASGPSGWRVWMRDVPGVVRAVGLVFLIGALARPVNTLSPQSADEEGIDIVVALDLSRSMRAVMEHLPQNLEQFVPKKPPGFLPTRLEAARAVLRDFISRRKTDRIGVVVFALDAFVLSPPTLDYQLLDSLVAKMELELIEGSGTAIGDGVGVAVARLRRSQARSKAVILLTDGDSNSGQIAPEYAADLAAKLGIKVFAIQIGQGQNSAIQNSDLFGQPRTVPVSFPTNPELLRMLAKKSDGQMYVASDAKALQDSFHSVLDTLEKTKFEANISSFEELYGFLLLPGVLLIAIEALLRSLALRRFP
jgi:Ca-activated chloride channel family protein